VAWKIYFFVYSALVILSYGAGWGERWIAYDYLDIPVQIVLLAGLYGYAFKKQIGNAGFWRKWLPLVVVWDLAGLLIRYDSSQDNERAVLMGVVIYLAYLIIIPAYCALYFYGHKSEKLWKPLPTPPQ